MITAIVVTLFGSSMVMVSGPTTAISTLLFAMFDGLAVHLRISKGDALAPTIGEIDLLIYATCTKRVFTGCERWS